MTDDMPEPSTGWDDEARRPLSEADKIEVFKIATRSLVEWFGDGIKAGMTNQNLAIALEASLGIFGGSGGPGQLNVAFTGSGVRIWGGWHVVNHVTEKPLFSGKRTIETARAIYNIKNPDDRQLDLF